MTALYKLIARLMRRKKNKVNIMPDVYKLIADNVCNAIDDKWEKAVVEIESSMGRMFATTCFYFLKNGKKEPFKLLDFDNDLDVDLGEAVFALQKSMYPENKWNRAVYTLEKNGHFDMEFIWDQELQDSWDS